MELDFEVENELIKNMEDVENYNNVKEIDKIEDISQVDNEKELIRSFINNLNTRLEKIKDAIIYVIDRFEGNFAICENRETKEIKQIEINKLPKNVHEGDVIKFENNKYELDQEEKDKIEEIIKDKIKNIFEEN